MINALAITTRVSRRAYLDRFPGYYQTADAGHFDEDGYLWVMARTDDVINIAGHRLSTGAIEEAIAGHPDVAECAVIGVKDSLKGELPLAFLVLNAGVDTDPEALVADVDRARARTDRTRRSLQASLRGIAACRRPDRARSCAVRCEKLRTPRRIGLRRRSTIPVHWTKYAAHSKPWITRSQAESKSGTAAA